MLDGGGGGGISSSVGGSHIDSSHNLLLDVGRHGLVPLQLHGILGAALSHAAQIGDVVEPATR